MALIECPECKQQISDKAESCPRCGQPINPKPKAKEGLFLETMNWGCACLIVLIVLFIIWLLISMSRVTPTLTPLPVVTPISPPTVTFTPTPTEIRPISSLIILPTPTLTPIEGWWVPANVLHQEYEANEIAADKKYKGKILYVTGVVQEIGSDLFDDPYVELNVKGPGEWSVVWSIKCYFEERYRDDLAHLKIGHRITVRGQCTGKGWSDVILRKCSPPN